MTHYTFTEFFIVIGILTFIYLAYVLLRYYRKEINALIAHRGQALPQPEEEEDVFGPFESQSSSQIHQMPFSEDFKSAEVIIPKIKEIIIHAGVNNYDHLQLYEALKTIITEYPPVNDPVIREGITELIIHECKKHGAVKPEKRELDELWDMTSD